MWETDNIYRSFNHSLNEPAVVKAGYGNPTAPLQKVIRLSRPLSARQNH